MTINTRNILPARVPFENLTYFLSEAAVLSHQLDSLSIRPGNRSILHLEATYRIFTPRPNSNHLPPSRTFQNHTYSASKSTVLSYSLGELDISLEARSWTTLSVKSLLTTSTLKPSYLLETRSENIPIGHSKPASPSCYSDSINT